MAHDGSSHSHLINNENERNGHSNSSSDYQKMNNDNSNGNKRFSYNNSHNNHNQQNSRHRQYQHHSSDTHSRPWSSHQRDDDGFTKVSYRRGSHNDNNNRRNYMSNSHDMDPHREQHNRTTFMIILCGIPGSGKSTFAKKLMNNNPHKYIRINQDELGNRHLCESECHSIIRRGKIPIIDRCNFDMNQRQHFLKIANQYRIPVDCVVFNYPLEDCIQRCELRSGHETIHKVNAREVVTRMMSNFNPPTLVSCNSLSHCQGQRGQEWFRVVKNVYSFEDAHDVFLYYSNHT